ncbi:MAG: hypothetical protein KC561_02755 [Myxococcales bacterium]|nr:hypothetical protein [Myxococcales bacterium]
MNILLVGAGAVGKVYGRHLQLGGAKVSFLVKEKYVQELAPGVTMYALNQPTGRRKVTFEGFGLLTTPEDVAEERWDQVWFCLPENAIGGAWMPPVLNAIGDAVLVSPLPGGEARRALERHVPPERLVTGLINMISYEAPIADEGYDEPGTAYWFPPLGKSLFGGPRPATDSVVGALKAGGCPAKFSWNAGDKSSFGSSMLMPFLVALEGAEWSFLKLRTKYRGLLDLAGEASREAIAGVCAESGLEPPGVRHLLRPSVFGFALKRAQKFVPLPLEPYFKYHFTKTRPQTVHLIDGYIDACDRYDIPAPSLKTLREKILLSSADGSGENSKRASAQAATSD